MAQRKLPRFLSILEVQEMFRVAETDKRDAMLLKCFFYLGLRNNELRSLRIEDIDFINGNVKVVQGKGKKDRYVPIPPFFVEHVRNYVGELREGPLFPGRDRKKLLSNRHLRRIVKFYARKAGIRNYPEVHPHTLRHSYATMLQNRGASLNEIQRLLGHLNIETTTIYTHLGIEDLKRTVNKVFADGK